eukprot:9963766-Ditylum_brightwellii.AAC.1
MASFPAQSPNSGPKRVYIFSLVFAMRYAELISAASIFILFNMARNIAVLTVSVFTTPDHTSDSG